MNWIHRYYREKLRCKSREKETRSGNMNFDENIIDEPQGPLWQCVAGWAIIIWFVLSMWFMLGTLTGCTWQVPHQTTVTNNITITETHNTAAEGATIRNETPVEVSADVRPEQTAENTTKSGMWIVWLIVIGLAAGAGIWLYVKKQKDES
jgi:hypothetical protein